MAVDPVKEYARFYTQWEKDLRAALRQASRDAGKAVATSGVATLRGARQQIALRAINDVLNGVGEATMQSLLSGRLDAARLAASVVSDKEIELFRSLGMSASDAAYYVRAEQLRAVAALETAARRVTQTRIPLSTQVYRTTALQKGMVDRAITAGLARGLSAKDLAKQVRSMIDPNTAGGVSFASKRLARTEINNAYHATAKTQMKAKPWVQEVEWRLSGSHPRTDICNDYAESEWTVDTVPDKPHPQCLCYIVPVMPSDQQFINGLFDGDYDDYLDDVMGRSGYTQDFINSSRFTEAMQRSPAVPKPGPNGERPISKSKDPAVRQKVADLSDEQYVRWMNDTRPVAKKMADPRYATDVRTPPVPEPTPPTPTPGVGSGSVGTNKNGIRAMENRWMEDLKSERGKIGWRVEDGKVVWDDADGLAKALKAAQRELSDARLDLADTLLSESARKAAQGVVNSMQKMVDDLEKAMSGETSTVARVIKPKPTVIDDLRTRVEGGTSYSEGWRIDKNKVTWDNEDGRRNLLNLARDIRDINLDNARDDFLSAAERTRAKFHARNLQELIDELATRVEASADGLDPIPDYLERYMQDIIYMARKGETLTLGQERTLEVAADTWMRRVGGFPRGFSRIPTSERVEIVDYWREQFDIRILGKKVNWPLDNPTDDIIGRHNVLKDMTFDTSLDDSMYGATYADRFEAMSKAHDVIDDIYDQFQPGQLAGTEIKMIKQTTFNHTQTLADASPLNFEVRLGTNMFQQHTPGSQSFSQKSGWWVKVDSDVDLVRQVITHEYGHITDFGLTYQERGEAFARIARALKISPPKEGKYGFDHATMDRWVKRHKDVITREISQYGSTNGREIMAELFCEILCNSYPRAAAQAYKDYLIEIGVLKP